MDVFDNGLRVGRREALYFMGSVMAVGFLASCSNEDGEASTTSPTSPSSATTSTTTTTTTTTSSAAQCVVTPALTEGPYFVDERLNRSDLRADPTTGVIKAGVPLTLALSLSQIASSGECTPLAGALVDVWHCDALGLYSDVSQNSTIGQKFLRGYQVSNASGVAQFTSIYPGWYSGRAVHIHFKVRTNPDSASGLEFTSQMFFDESLTDLVHGQEPYGSKGRRDTTLTSDSIYRSGGTSVLVPLSMSGDGYTGTMNVGVRV